MIAKDIALLLSMFLCLSGCLGTKHAEHEWATAEHGIFTAALNRTGSLGFVGSVHQGGGFWNVKTQKQLYVWNHSNDSSQVIYHSAMTPDGRYVLSGDTHNLALWDARSGKAIGFWEAPSKIVSLALSANGQFALIGLNNYTAIYFNVREGGIIHTFHHQGIVKSVDLDDVQKFAITGSDDSSAKLWHLGTGKLQLTIAHTNQVNMVALSPSGNLAFTSAQSDDSSIWLTSTGQRQTKLKVANTRYTSAEFSHQEKYLVTGNALSTIQLWHTSKPTAIRSWRASKRSWFDGPNFEILAVSLSTKRRSVSAFARNGMAYHFKL